MIIGISGKKNSGKDTFVHIYNGLLLGKTINEIEKALTNDYFFKFTNDTVILRFADPVKDIVCTILNCTREQLEDRDFKETPVPNDYTGIEITPRLLMEKVGNDFARAIHPDIWLNNLFTRYDNLRKVTNNFIIPDVRYHNEADGILERPDSYLFRINRPFGSIDTPMGTRWLDPEYWHFEKTGKKLPESETALDDYHFEHVINNNGSLRNFIENVAMKLRFLKLV
jgi:hypothetical protein